MDRNVKIYRKLLQGIVCFCTDRKYELYEAMLFRKKFNGRKIQTDFERGYYDGYHSAMNDVLKRLDLETDLAELNWIYIDGKTRRSI